MVEEARATGGHAATPAPARATGETATGKRPRRQVGNAGGAAVGCAAPPPLDNKAGVVAACGHAEAATAFSASAAAAAATPRVPPIAAADVPCTTGVAATGRWPRRRAGGSGGAAVGRSLPHTPYGTAGAAVIGGRAEVASAAVWSAAAAAAAVPMPTAATANADTECVSEAVEARAPGGAARALAPARSTDKAAACGRPRAQGGDGGEAAAGHASFHTPDHKAGARPQPTAAPRQCWRLCA